MTAVALHCEVSGRPDGPVVLLLGSLGSTSAMWQPQLPALERHFTVVRCDARGHGRSPTPPGPYALDDLVDDVVALLGRLAAPRAHVVGLSLGGMLGLRLAAREPDRVSRLAVLCTSAYLGSRKAWEQRAALVRERGTDAVAEAVVSRWFTTQLSEEDPGLVSRMRQMVASTPAEGYASCCDAIAVLDLRGDLPRVSAPVLAVAGEDDPATPPHHLALIASAVQDGRLVRLARASHLANVERAEEVNALLLAHLLRPDVEEEPCSTS